MILFGVVLGFVLTIVSTMSAWLALGSGSLMRRLVVVAGIVSAAALAFCFAIEPEAEWMVLIGLSLVIHSTGFLLLRSFGYRLQQNHKTDIVPSDGEFKFSVSQIMVLTAVIAVVTWLASGFLAFGGGFRQLALFALVAISCSVIALSATWNTWIRPGDKGVITFALTVVVTAAFLFFVFEWTGFDPGLVWASAAVTFAGCFWLACHKAKRWGLSVLKMAAGSQSEPQASYR